MKPCDSDYIPRGDECNAESKMRTVLGSIVGAFLGCLLAVRSLCCDSICLTTCLVLLQVLLYYFKTNPSRFKSLASSFMFNEVQVSVSTSLEIWDFGTE